MLNSKCQTKLFRCWISKPPDDSDFQIEKHRIFCFTFLGSPGPNWPYIMAKCKTQYTPFAIISSGKSSKFVILAKKPAIMLTKWCYVQTKHLKVPSSTTELLWYLVL